MCQEAQQDHWRSNPAARCGIVEKHVGSPLSTYEGGASFEASHVSESSTLPPRFIHASTATRALALRMDTSEYDAPHRSHRLAPKTLRAFQHEAQHSKLTRLSRSKTEKACTGKYLIAFDDRSATSRRLTTTRAALLQNSRFLAVEPRVSLTFLRDRQEDALLRMVFVARCLVRLGPWVYAFCVERLVRWCNSTQTFE